MESSGGPLVSMHTLFQEKYDRLWIVLLGALFFLPFLGGVHLYDWDEVNFAECAREMIETGNYLQVQIDFQPFWEKPPLFFWLQAVSMHLFGINEYAARFPNAVAGILCLLLLYGIGKSLKDRLFGWLWVLTYFGSILPHLYFKSGIIDPWFNLFIFLGLYLFIRFYWSKQNKVNYRFLLLGGTVLGLGVLTKGPVAILLAFLCLGIYWIFSRFRWYVKFTDFVLFGLVSLAVTATWLGLEILANGTWFTEEFIRYQYRLLSTPDAGHKGFPGYHFVVLLFGCFPASAFIFSARKKHWDEQDWKIQDLQKWMWILLAVVLVIFSLVQSKIIHYSSLAYYPVSFLAATALYPIICRKAQLPGLIRFLLIFMAGLIGTLVVLFAFFGKDPSAILFLFEKDQFAQANLQADVYWSGFEGWVGLYLLAVVFGAYLLFRKRKNRSGTFVLFLGTGLFVSLALISFVKRVEGYSQRAAIEFLKNLQTEKVYIRPVGYKSYAHLYYTMKKPGNRPEAREWEWLTKGPIDRDVYFITKIHKTKELEGLPEVEEIGRKNGFVFYKRSKS